MNDFFGDKHCTTHYACDCIQAKVKTLEARVRELEAAANAAKRAYGVMLRMRLFWEMDEQKEATYDLELHLFEVALSMAGLLEAAE